MDPKPRVAITDLFFTFLRFSCVTFGGGWSLIAQIQKEYVDKKGWITNEELLDFTSVGRSLPGLMVGNASVLFGYRVAGLAGAIAALLGVVLPPFIIMIGITLVYALIKDHPLAARAMMGVRAAVVPIIISAMTKLFRAGMKDAFCCLLAAGGMALCLFTKINNVWIVLLGAGLGLMYMEVRARHGVS
ncbi:MAG: chromate transporter [Clostridia bacterium]|nr:chromate transporter [Clostridia bacterium]